MSIYPAQIIKNYIKQNSSNNNNNNNINYYQSLNITNNELKLSNKKNSLDYSFLFQDYQSECNLDLFKQSSEKNTELAKPQSSLFATVCNHRKSSFEMESFNNNNRYDLAYNNENNQEYDYFLNLDNGDNNNVSSSSFFDEENFENNILFKQQESVSSNFCQQNEYYNQAMFSQSSQQSAQFQLQQPFESLKKDEKQQQQQQNDSDETKKKFQKDSPFKIIRQSKKIARSNKKDEPKKNCKNYDKNICRYLTRTTIRALANGKYMEKVLQLAHGDQELYSETADYFLRRIESISGLRILKKFLDVQSEQDEEIRSYKLLFKRFYKWFLKNRITRFILTKGKMDNKEMYIEYKNKVMLKYADNLQKWTCNKTDTLQ